MTNSKAIDTPMPTTVNLDRDENDKPVDIKRYKGIIGSVIWWENELGCFAFDHKCCG